MARWGRGRSVIESYARQFEAFQGNGGGAGPGWLVALRRAAFAEFRRTGFPSPRDEEWRFTSIAPIARAEFGDVAPPVSVGLAAIEPFLFGHLEWPRLVFLNGRFAPSLSLLPGVGSVRLAPLGTALEAGGLEGQLGRHVVPGSTPFTALNTALSRDGAVVEIAPNAEPGVPIHLLFVATKEAEGIATHPRILVKAGAQSRSQLLESYVALPGTSRYFTNAVAEVVVDAGAWLEHSRIQREGDDAFHVAFTRVSQAHESHYRSFSFAMGGAIARHNLETRLGAPNSEALLYGLYFGHGDQLVDTHTTIFHDHPNCRSWEVYKGILDDRSHGVFNGKIMVDSIAQKTDAKQTNRVLLLSDAARIDTKPQLEIFADDVKCTHGATVGQLDTLAAFYLKSRGIPSNVADRLLVYAFAAEVLAEVASAPVRAALDALVHDRLDSRL